MSVRMLLEGRGVAMSVRIAGGERRSYVGKDAAGHTLCSQWTVWFDRKKILPCLTEIEIKNCEFSTEKFRCCV